LSVGAEINYLRTIFYDDPLATRANSKAAIIIDSTRSFPEWDTGKYQGVNRSVNVLVRFVFPPSIYHVCEAVDEYIYHLHPAGLETRLRGFAAQPSDPHEMRKKYLEWADCIAQSASKNQPDQT